MRPSRLVWLAFLALLSVSKAARHKNQKYRLGKILGGRPAPHGRFPFMLSLEENGVNMCGAAAIERNWAITAAHCVSMPGEESSAATLKLRSGTVVKESGGTEHPVAKVVAHPAYGKSVFSDDIALLKVHHPFDSSAYVKYLKLPGKYDSIQEGTNVTVMGWGYTTADSDGGYSQDLKDVTLLVQSDEECESKQSFERLRILLRLKDKVFVKDKMFCASSAGSDTADGDSGGPVVVGAESDPILVGLVSWGEGKGDPDKPGVYTRVSGYTNWIVDTVKSG